MPSTESTATQPPPAEVTQETPPPTPTEANTPAAAENQTENTERRLEARNQDLSRITDTIIRRTLIDRQQDFDSKNPDGRTTDGKTFLDSDPLALKLASINYLRNLDLKPGTTQDFDDKPPARAPSFTRINEQTGNRQEVSIHRITRSTPTEFTCSVKINGRNETITVPRGVVIAAEIQNDLADLQGTLSTEQTALLSLLAEQQAGNTDILLQDSSVATMEAAARASGLLTIDDLRTAAANSLANGNLSEMGKKYMEELAETPKDYILASEQQLQKTLTSMGHGEAAYIEEQARLDLSNKNLTVELMQLAGSNIPEAATRAAKIREQIAKNEREMKKIEQTMTALKNPNLIRGTAELLTNGNLSNEMFTQITDALRTGSIDSLLDAHPDTRFNPDDDDATRGEKQGQRDALKKIAIGGGIILAVIALLATTVTTTATSTAIKQFTSA